MNAKNIFSGILFLITLVISSSVVNSALFSSRALAISEEDIISAREKAFSCALWAEENEYCTMALRQSRQNTRETLLSLQRKYHGETNEYINANLEKISHTFSFQGAGCRQQESSFETGEANTWAIYLERKIEFYKYHAALHYLAANIGVQGSAAEIGSGIAGALSSSLTLKEEILWELEIARRSLIATLEGYAQMRILYPLHQELEVLICELNILRDEWQKFVEQIARMPAKFINASAPQ